MEDKMLVLIFQTFNGKLAPVSHYISAWNQTAKRFGDGMRTDSALLVTLCRTTAAWEHLWTGWKHSESEAGGPGRVVQEPGTGGVGASPRKDQQATVTRLQSERDRAINELKHAKKKSYNPKDDGRDGVVLKSNDDWKKESGGGKKRRRGGGDR